jgi:hypothetical protein
MDVDPDHATDPEDDTYPDPSGDAAEESDPHPDVPLPCGLVLDGPTYDLSFLEAFEGYPRAPTECGECCRQVTYSQNDIMICTSFRVQGKHLVMSTWDGAAPGTSRAILVDLSSLNHFLLEETDDTLSPVGTSEGTRLSIILGSEVLIQHRLADYGTMTVFSTLRRIDMASEEDSNVWSLEYQRPSGAEPIDISAGINWVSWIDIRYPAVSGFQLYTFNPSSGEERHITTTDPDCCVSEPEIHGSKVVYRDGKSNIHVYDITTDTSVKVAGVDEWDWDRYSPAIWGDIVAWHDTRNGGTDASQTHTDVYVTDITVGGEQVVCDHPASQPGGVAVGDGFIVWPDTRNDPEYPNLPSSATNWDLYLYDIETGEERQLTDLEGRIEHCPKIYSNRVYFVMEDDFGIMSVFEITLPEYDGAAE